MVLPGAAFPHTFPSLSPRSAGSRNESINLGARFSKHGLLGRSAALTSLALPARSRAAGQEQRHASVLACTEVGAGGGSWQCRPAWQGSRGPDLSGFENRTGTRRTFVFSSGAGTGPSGCPRDVMASWPPSGRGKLHSDTPGSLAAPLHRSHVVLRRQSPKLSPSSPAARLAGGAPPGPPAGMSSSRDGPAFSWKPCRLSPRLTCSVSLGEVREFVPLLDAKCDCCPQWHKALN